MNGMSDPDRGDDRPLDPDLPGGIRYDPDLAVHEPMRVPAEPAEPSRGRTPLLLFPLGLFGLALGVYILFGLVASEGRTSADYLDAIRLDRGGAWQAAFELSRLLPLEPPARRDARFLPGLIAVFGSAEGGDPRVRRYLALSLGEVGDARAVDALLGALGDPDVQTVIYAAWALGRIGQPRAAAGLLPLLQSEEADVRKMAAYALGALEAPGVVEGLRPLINDPVEDVAWNAALALARRGDDAGLPLVARMLDRAYLDGVSRPDEAGRPLALTERQKEEAMVNALRSIAGLRDRRHLELVHRIRDGDPNPRVRQAAFETLETLSR
jgi:hypothetical protein